MTPAILEVYYNIMSITTQLKLSKLTVPLPVDGKVEDREIDAYVNEQEEPVIHEELINIFFPKCKKPSKINMLLDLSPFENSIDMEVRGWKFVQNSTMWARDPSENNYGIFLYPAFGKLIDELLNAEKIKPQDGEIILIWLSLIKVEDT